MKKTFIVAQWEYLEKVKSKAFLIGLFLTPMIMVGVGILPGLLAGKEDSETKVVGILDPSGEFGSLLAKRLEGYKLSNGDPNYLVRVLGGSGSDLDSVSRAADQAVASGELDAYIVLPSGSDTTCEYHSRAAGDFRLMARLQEHLRAILAERRLVKRGIDPDIVRELDVPLNIKAVKVTATGEKEETGFVETFFSAYIFVMAMFFLIFTSGQLLVRSVLEEKSNRIIEVLVSSCSSSELMAGKVLGLSAMGLTQMGFWALVGLAAVSQFGSAVLPPVEHILLMAVFFILGYLFYSAIFIAFGTPVTTEQEAQQISGYLVLFVILPVVLVIPVMKSPDAAWVKILTFIPVLTPTFMALRIPVQMPSITEVVASIVVLALSTYVMMMVAARIFRVAILATGKRPSLKELLHWATER